MKKKLIALALLLCMSFGVLAGCAESDPYDYDLTPVISLEKDGTPVYINVEVPKKDIEDALQEVIQAILDENAVKHEQNKDDASQNAVAEDKDTVNIDYKGVATGKVILNTFKKDKDGNYEKDDDGNLVPDFEFFYDPAKPKELPSDLKSKLVGLTIGAGSQDAPLIAAYETTLPDTLVNSDGTTKSDFAGKTVTLTVYKIHSVKRTVPATDTEKETTEIVTSGEVQEDDLVKVDLAYTLKDPVAFTGGSTYKTAEDGSETGSGYDLKLGSGSFVDDFEDQLVGKKLGETVEVKVTFPSTYTSNTTLENMDVTFTTVLNYLSRSPKELTDDMVKTYTEEQRASNGSGKIYTSAETYKKEMRDSIVESKVFEVVLGKATVLSWDLVPELRETYDAYWETIEESYTYFYSMGWFTGTYNSYLVSTWPAYYLFQISTQFSSPEELAQYVLTISKDDVKRQLVLHAIAQLEEITVSEEEYNEGVSRLFPEYETDEIDSEKAFIKEYGETNIRNTLKMEKVYELLRREVVETEDADDTTT